MVNTGEYDTDDTLITQKNTNSYILSASSLFFIQTLSEL